MRTIYFLSLFFLIFLFTFPTNIYADGTYSQLNTSAGSTGSPDAVTWSTGNPIMIDSFGKYIVPVQTNGDSNYHFVFSNNAGSSWTETSGLTNPGRVSAVYDSKNDKIHVLNSGGTSTGTTYRRFSIIRDTSYNITSIIVDPMLTAMSIDTQGVCSSFDSGDPIILFKDNGTDQKLIIFWSVTKTCSAVSVTETRASMRILSNDSNDGTQGNWLALNGTSDSSGATGPALIAYNKIYTYTGSHVFFQQSAMILGGSTAKQDDIYYFNIDENSTHGFRRLVWNSGSNNWSGSWTSRSTFGGDVNNGQGYNLKSELLSKPVYASAQEKVYVGIARWLDNTNGDTQSMYSVDSSDTIALASDVYSASGTHCIYPTFDLSYDSSQDKVYFFYDISGSGSTCGNVYYKTYDGSSLSSATAFYTVADRSVDIPITYPSRYNDKILLFFRLNNALNSGTPPHDIYFGSVSLNSTSTAASQTVSTPYAATTYSDFYKTCTTLSTTQVINNSGGEIAIPGSFRDDFETPTSPYTALFSEWDHGTWSGGSYTPAPSGTLLVYGANGAYILGTTSYTRKVLEFRAKFTAHDFQHVGWANGTSFNEYSMFSTASNGQLNARAEAGSGETATALGSSYLGSYHKYKIDWGTSDSKFYIDDTLVATINTSNASGMYMIASNNTTTSGSDLTVDWMRILNFPSTTGTYLSCPLDSQVAGNIWGALTFSSTLPTSTALTVKTRTSSDNSTWSSYSSAISSGDTVSSSPDRYLQYQVTLTGTSSDTPTFDSISLPFASPTPSPSATTTSTPTASTSQVSGAPQCNASTPLGIPYISEAMPISSTELKLIYSNWSSYYTIEYGENQTTFTNAVSGVLGGSFNIKALKANTTYYFRVAEKNDCTIGA